MNLDQPATMQLGNVHRSSAPGYRRGRLSAGWLVLQISVSATLLAASTLGAAAAVGGEHPIELRAVVGEASGDGYIGMLAISGALHNRLKVLRHPYHGVYGINAKHNSTEPAWVWVKAAKAWNEGATNDITLGAVYWGSEEDLKKCPKQYAKLTKTVKVGHTTFFK